MVWGGKFGWSMTECMVHVFCKSSTCAKSEYFVIRTFQKMSSSTLLSISVWSTAGHLAVTSWWGPMLLPAWGVSSTAPRTRPQTTGPQQVKDYSYKIFPLFIPRWGDLKSNLYKFIISITVNDDESLELEFGDSDDESLEEFHSSITHLKQWFC